MFVNNSISQTNCNNNLFVNPNFDNGLNGWTNLSSGLSTVNFWNENQSLQPNIWLPQPPSGNYIGMWIANNFSSNSSLREGIINTLNTPIPVNSGTYTISFDYCCLSTCGGDGGNPANMPEIGIYGISASAGLNISTIQNSHTPTNLDLFGSNNSTLIKIETVNSFCGDEPLIYGAYPVNEKGTKYQFTHTFNSNLFPAEITHILITRSDNIIPVGNLFMGFDSFCLSKDENQNECCLCCERLKRENKALKIKLKKCFRLNPVPGGIKPIPGRKKQIPTKKKQF